MDHPKTVQWEEKLKALFDEVDDFLEDKYGKAYPLHPNRPQRGTTSNKEQDGLFNVGTSFSAGFGSDYGRGYVISVRFSTLANVDSAVIDKIRREIADIVRAKLKTFFPGRDLYVDYDRDVLKIHGDLSLGSL